MLGFQEFKKHGVEKSACIPSTAIFASFVKTFLFFLFVYVSSFTAIADAATYYVAPNGSDGSGGTSSAPWGTFAKAMTRLQAGDALIVKDGTYNQSLNVTVSGTSINRITIKAENDGQVVVDGQNVRNPFLLQNRDDITVEGLVFKNSVGSVVVIQNADRITLKRVSAYNASIAGNFAVYSVEGTNNLLLEDCAGAGSGRVIFNIYGANYTTLRRCWARWERDDGAGGDTSSLFQIYGSDNSIAENCIGTKNPNGYRVVDGLSVWANYYNTHANDNKMYGNVIYGLNGWHYNIASAKYNIYNNAVKNSVSIDGEYGVIQYQDNNLVWENMTIVGASKQAFTITAYSYTDTEPGYTFGGYLRNSSLSTGSGTGIVKGSSPRIAYFIHEHNNVYNYTTPYRGTSPVESETSLTPGYNTTIYGKGAYLMVPTALKGKGESGADIGAEVLYRYEDGVLTNVPLWPWPMENRIYRERGICVTWESKGGLWKTLNGVYK